MKKCPLKSEYMVAMISYMHLHVLIIKILAVEIILNDL